MPLPLFGKSHKSPPDIVKNLKDSLTQLEKLERGDKKNEKVAEEVSKSLQAIKGIIYGQESQEPHMEQVSFFRKFFGFLPRLEKRVKFSFSGKSCFLRHRSKICTLFEDINISFGKFHFTKFHAISWLKLLKFICLCNTDSSDSELKLERSKPKHDAVSRTKSNGFYR